LGVLAPPVTAATTSITLKPSVGPPTTKVTVTGTGFGGGETVALTFSGTPVQTNPSPITTTSSGTFTDATFVVPASAVPGNHPVKATGQTSGLSFTRNFLVRTDWPKFHFDLDNSGFNPHENVLNKSTVSGLKLAWTEAA